MKDINMANQGGYFDNNLRWVQNSPIDQFNYAVATTASTPYTKPYTPQEKATGRNLFDGGTYGTEAKSALSPYGTTLQKQQAHDQAVAQSTDEFNKAEGTTPASSAFSALDGFNSMSSYGQNDALYKIGQQESYTPAQLDQLTKLDTSALATGGIPDLYTGSDFSKLSEAQQLDFAKAGGTLGDTGNMIPGTGNSSSWVNGLSNFETLQGVAGIGGLAMNAYGMFGSGGTMDVNKKNIDLMNQQIANNKEEMANRKGFRADIKSAFSSKA